MAHNTGTLAKGCFGKVYKEKYNDKWAAIKRVPIGLISRKDLDRECAVYRKADHPNIVKLLGPVTMKDSKYVIPMEFILGEDLETTIFKVSQSKIPLTLAAKNTIILGMCEGLLHLHLRDIVHQDLKPDNIMVEHDTNRAVIIDLGLAKFFKRGLNSAMNIGNEAYAAPEVLQLGGQRDQRSDVWAMGKIIAELCARVRLVTPTVKPEKISETLKDNPYCRAICRMVQPDPALRATMAGVMSAIRLAGSEKAKPTGAGGARGITPPPRPSGAGGAPGITPPARPSGTGGAPGITPPARPSGTGGAQGITPPARPSGTGGAQGITPPARPSGTGGGTHLTPPINRFNHSPSPIGRAGSPYNRSPSPMNRSPSPLNWERTPRPEASRTPPRQHLTPTPPKNQDRLHPAAPERRSPSPPSRERTSNPEDTLLTVVPKRDAAQVTPDFMRMALYQEAAKDLPCDLPTTGRVIVRRFEEKNGEMAMLQQKEVVIRDGRIIKLDDMKIDNI